jgi:hypothetical protein
LKSVDGFLGQHHAERIADFADLELDHREPLIVITMVTTFLKRAKETVQDLDAIDLRADI